MTTIILQLGPLFGKEGQHREEGAVKVGTTQPMIEETTEAVSHQMEEQERPPTEVSIETTTRPTTLEID